MKQFEFCLLQSIKLQIMCVPHSLLISFKQLIKVSIIEKLNGGNHVNDCVAHEV